MATCCCSETSGSLLTSSSPLSCITSGAVGDRGLTGGDGVWYLNLCTWPFPCQTKHKTTLWVVELEKNQVLLLILLQSNKVFASFILKTLLDYKNITWIQGPNWIFFFVLMANDSLGCYYFVTWNVFLHSNWNCVCVCLCNHLKWPSSNFGSCNCSFWTLDGQHRLNSAQNYYLSEWIWLHITQPEKAKY